MGSADELVNDVLVTEFDAEQIRTSADVAVWVLHRCLIYNDDITSLDLGIRLPSNPGRSSSQYCLNSLDLDFEISFVCLGRFLLAHTHIIGDRNVYIERIDLYGITADAAGLQAFIRRYSPNQLVEDVILKPVIQRAGRVRQLSVQEAALIHTIDQIVATISIQDPYELLCIAIHSMLVNENLQLVWIGNPSNLCSSFELPQNWNERKHFYKFSYRCPGRSLETGRHSEGDIVMTCLPFHSASKLIVRVQSNIPSSDFCSSTNNSTVKLSVKRFVDSSMKLKNLPVLISMLYNSISKIFWMPIADNDSLHLPPWILLLCLSFLTHPELSLMRSVNPYFRHICLHPFLWKSLYMNHFGWDKASRQAEPSDWRLAFITKWRKGRRL